MNPALPKTTKANNKIRKNGDSLARLKSKTVIAKKGRAG